MLPIRLVSIFGCLTCSAAVLTSGFGMGKAHDRFFRGLPRGCDSCFPYSLSL